MIKNSKYRPCCFTHIGYRQMQYNRYNLVVCQPNGLYHGVTANCIHLVVLRSPAGVKLKSNHIHSERSIIWISVWSDNGGHDVIDKFEFPCNSLENLFLSWNFTNTVINNLCKIIWEFQIRWGGISHFKPLRRYLRYFRGTHWRSSLSRSLLAFYTWVNRVTDACTQHSVDHVV